MSDLGRRLGFMGSRASSREKAASEEQNPEVVSPTKEPLTERRSFTRRRPAEPKERLPSFDNHPSEHSTLLPSLLSRPPTSPCYDGSEQPFMGDAQRAAVQAMATAAGGGDQAPLSPRSPVPMDPAGAHRTGRSRGLFKAHSFLNLRSNSSFGSNGSGTMASKGKKGEDDDGRSTTPIPQSPRETLSALQWFEFGGIGRRVSSRTGSNKSGGHERERDRSTDAGGQYSTSPPNAMPSLQPGVSNASSYFTMAESSPKAPQRPVQTVTSHDWKQWNRESDTGFSRLVNESDFTWHRPSFKQIVESLQVAVMSGETAPTMPTTAWPSQRSTLPSHLASQPAPPPSKRRPSLPPLPSARTFSHEHPIPGRYRSHIMRAIEGLQDIQAALDMTKAQVEEARKSHERDLVQFAGLSKEWAAREQHFDDEIRSLRYSLAAAEVTERAHLQKGRREEAHGAGTALATELTTVDGPTEAQSAVSTSFHDRVKETIQSSSCTTKSTPLPVPPVEQIDLFGER
jgi:hypothetical protein